MDKTSGRILGCPGACLLLLAGCGAPSPVAHVADATEIGIVMQSSHIVGRDGAWSALAWGHSVWTFGDTVLAMADKDGQTWHSNSVSFTDDLNAADGIGGLDEQLDRGAPRLALPKTADEATFDAAHAGNPCMEKPCGARWAAWPRAAVFDPDGHRAIIPYELVHAEPGDFNFYGVGESFALWRDFKSPADRPALANCPDHPTLLFCQNESDFTNGPVISDGFLFTFACDKDGFSNHCKLGRVPLAGVLDKRAWQYWDGGAWTSAMSAAKPLFDGAPIVGVFFNAHFNVWMAVYSSILSNEVVYRTAPALTGPWSGPAHLFTADHKASDGGATYDALPHPEYEEGGGQTIYVTHSRPNGNGWFGSELALVKIRFQ